MNIGNKKLLSSSILIICLMTAISNLDFDAVTESLSNMNTQIEMTNGVSEETRQNFERMRQVFLDFIDDITPDKLKEAIAELERLYQLIIRYLDIINGRNYGTFELGSFSFGGKKF